MEAGIVRGGRTLLALLTAAALVASMLFLLAGTAEANHEPPDDIFEQEAGSNDAPYWVDYLEDVRGITDATCEKIDQAADEAFVMPSPPSGQVWVLLDVKQATTNYVYYDPVAGHSYPSLGQQAPGYSHIIVCYAPEPPPTTTSTTVPEETTTVPEETTTLPEETTTTVGETTTTVEILETTLTSAPTTSSTVEDEVLGKEVLPFTGLETGELAIVASALALLGSLVLLSARRAED
ncbi:MAG TPA: hypothetical protein VGB33_02815 [Acidimicrobiia bacterium]|jgi:hypothetical protein